MDRIILDVDGTIWDSKQSVADSWNIPIKKHTGPHLPPDPVPLTPAFG